MGFVTSIYFKPSLSASLCDTSCEPSTEMPDDEVKKLIKIKSRLFVGGARFGVNTIALANKPGQSERTMIEDFPSTPLEDLQDSFGIYKETLSKKSPNIWKKCRE